MRILVYGAGVIGSIFAGKLAQKGYDVTVLARGDRYAEISRDGIILRNALSGKTEKAHVKPIRSLHETDRYDYVIIAVQNTQIDDILPVLSKNLSPNLVFAVNNPSGYQKWIEVVGRQRIMIGFPSAGGVRTDGEVCYFIGTGFAKLFQSTTFGELDGKHTERLKRLLHIFKHAGFQPAITKKPDAWQKTHVAVVLPVAKALYRYQSNNYALAKSFRTLKYMVFGTRELFRILKSTGVRIEPKKLYIYYLPAFIIVSAFMIIMNTKIAEYAMAQHTIVAKEEMEVLEAQFLSLNTHQTALRYYHLITYYAEKSNNVLHK